MRRTVNDARMPSPRRRMTTPSNACVRSFSPSTTLTCTRTVSPGANALRSFLICPASTNRIASMTVVPSLAAPLLRLLTAFESFQQLAIIRRQLGVRQQIGARPPRQPQRLAPAPTRDARVIAGQQHRRHPRAKELFRARVLRRLQEP